MGFLLNILVIVGALFLGIVFLLELGRRIRLARMEREGDAGKGVGAVEGAVYGLLGLLIAFTFSGAATRFEGRRHLIVEEANAIGTAYLRLDLLPAEARSSLQEKFRQYVDSRLEIYKKLPDLEAAKAALDKSNNHQNAIWAEAVATGRRAGGKLTGGKLDMQRSCQLTSNDYCMPIVDTDRRSTVGRQVAGP